MKGTGNHCIFETDRDKIRMLLAGGAYGWHNVEQFEFFNFATLEREVQNPLRGSVVQSISMQFSDSGRLIRLYVKGVGPINANKRKRAIDYLRSSPC